MKKAFLVLCVALLVVSSVFAQGGSDKKYPSETINLIVHAAPGGGSDAMARQLATVMQKNLGVPVVCDNKTGASGSIAMTYVANSKPNGYTIGTAPCELSMVHALGYSKLTPDDVELLGCAQTWAACLTVPASAPYNTLDEFIAYCKANPNKVVVANSGTGSIWHIASAMMQDQTGIVVNDVPFDGASGAVTALLGGQVQAMTVGTIEAAASIKNGDAKCLAVFNDTRASILPDVPTTAELGYPDLKAIVWVGLLAPKGMEESVKATLVDAVRDAVHSDTFKNFTKSYGSDWNYMDPVTFKAQADADFAYYTELFAKLGLSK
jgi:tripartite-type tricarboxylate transporter receptor subunit TctC